MWTVVWIDENSADHYERCESAEEVRQVLRENHVDDDLAVLIFPPDTEMGLAEFLRLHR